MAETDPGANESADRLATLGTLVAGVAHEINNPITYVLANLAELETLCGALREAALGYREAARAAPGPDADERLRGLDAKLASAGGAELIDELISDALEGAERIRAVVGDLLGVARASEGAREPVDVHEALDASLRMAQRSSRVRVSREYAARSRASGDRERLGQVFLNLVANAIDACEDGEAEIALRTRDLRDAVEIEIEDSGRGVDPALRTRVFEPFFTTKEAGRGTGLGLFISREIVTRHGGTLGFRSRPDGGTIFRVTLPREDRHVDP